MLKKFSWILELIIITLFFLAIGKLFRLIGLYDYCSLVFGQLMNIVGVTVLGLFAKNKIAETSSSAENSLGSFFRKRLSPKDLLLIFPILIISSLTYSYINKLEFVHSFSGTNPTAFFPLTSWQLWSIILLIGISFTIGAIAEELYFRCYLFQVQFKFFNIYTWIINGLSWSIYHIYSPTNFLALLPSCLMYSYVFQKRRNIWITIIAHVMHNFLYGLNIMTTFYKHYH